MSTSGNVITSPINDAGMSRPHTKSPLASASRSCPTPPNGLGGTDPDELVMLTIVPQPDRAADRARTAMTVGWCISMRGGGRRGELELTGQTENRGRPCTRCRRIVPDGIFTPCAKAQRYEWIGVPQRGEIIQPGAMPWAAFFQPFRLAALRALLHTTPRSCRGRT